MGHPNSSARRRTIFVVSDGERVLVHGGARAVGLYAVQLADISGPRVITTVAAQDIDFVNQFGADETIDYKASGFEEVIRDVDVIFDGVGGETLERSWDVLKPGGRMITITADSEGHSRPASKRSFLHSRAESKAAY